MYDTCDKCGVGVEALAKVRNLLTLKELHFCGHHLNEYAEALDAAGFYTVSRRPAETKEPEPA